MFNTYTERNKYGGYTHEIKIDSTYFMRLIEMGARNINVELIEKRILKKNKVHFSIFNHDSLVGSVKE